MQCGAVIIADHENYPVRRIAPDKTMGTIAGTFERGAAGDGGPATLAHHEPVGAHAQRFAHQSVQPERARAFQVRLTRLERDDMRMRDLQFGDILEHQDPLVARRSR